MTISMLGIWMQYCRNPWAVSSLKTRWWLFRHNAPWCFIHPADKTNLMEVTSFGFSGSIDTNRNQPIQFLGLFRVLITINWCIASVVLIMSFCSRHVSLFMRKLFKNLSFVEDANDPKGISRHLSWRWRRGCESVEQYRLFLYICVCLCVRIFA